MGLKNGFLARIRGASRGQTFTEYSIVLLLVGIAAYSAYAGLGLGIRASAENIMTFISAAVASI
jgi:hypothetical protein